jgi:hypothetical protein
MRFLIQLRTRVRKYISSHEVATGRIFRFLLSFVSLLVLNQTFGYQKYLTHWWVSLLVACLCAFLPLQGAGLVIIFMCMMQLATLSAGVAGLGLILVVISYGTCAYVAARDTYHFVTVPVFYHLHIPFAMPVIAGLFRDFSEIATVICGSVLSFYLKVVKENASSFLDDTTDMTASRLLQNQILGNNMFYLYLVSMVVCYLLVYYIHNLKIKNAWYLAAFAGLCGEFIVMLAACLFVGSRSDIPTLILGNVVVLAFSLVAVFFIQGLDYTRIERVQYEDDEYYYYVTAVPKARIEEQEKEVKKITERK